MITARMTESIKAKPKIQIVDQQTFKNEVITVLILKGLSKILVYPVHGEMFLVTIIAKNLWPIRDSNGQTVKYIDYAHTKSKLTKEG